MTVLTSEQHQMMFATSNRDGKYKDLCVWNKKIMKHKQADKAIKAGGNQLINTFRLISYTLCAVKMF